MGNTTNDKSSEVKENISKSRSKSSTPKSNQNATTNQSQYQNQTTQNQTNTNVNTNQNNRQNYNPNGAYPGYQGRNYSQNGNPSSTQNMNYNPNYQNNPNYQQPQGFNGQPNPNYQAGQAPNYYQYPQPAQTAPESKTAIGVVCGLFLGLIGLIIGICLFKEGSFERKTFMHGWLVTFVSVVAVGLFLVIIYSIYVFLISASLTGIIASA